MLSRFFLCSKYMIHGKFILLKSDVRLSDIDFVSKKTCANIFL